MTDVGLGERITAYGRFRTKVARQAVKDTQPLSKMLEEEKGVIRVAGGRTYLNETISGLNSTVSYVGENGQVALSNQNVLDSPESNWTYLLGSVSMSRAEQYMNEGPGRYIEVYGAKQDSLEASMMNIHHAGLLSNGTGTSGLQIDGLAAALSTTPTTGTYASIDRSSANAAWFRNQKFDANSDWSLGGVDSSNAKKFLDKLLNLTSVDGVSMISGFLAGQDHFEAFTDSFGAMQVIQNVNDTGKAGFQTLVYRGKKIYYGGGINYSGQSGLTSTRTYGICCKPGGFNLVYHKKAEFDMLPQVDAADSAAFSRLMFTMALTTLGAHAKACIVGFNT